MGSNEAYLDELLKTMSQREEEAQNGVSVGDEESMVPFSGSEAEAVALTEESETVPELEELPIEPGMGSEAKELFAEPGMGLEEEDLFAEPEMELEEEGLFVGSESEEPSAEPELGFEELFAGSETGTVIEEQSEQLQAGMEFEELAAGQEPGIDADQLPSESEILLAESGISSNAETAKPDFGQENLNESEEDDIWNVKPSTEEVKDMSEEEIFQLLQLSAGEAEQEEVGSGTKKDKEMADDDLDKLLKDMEKGDDNLAEINDLLYKAENNQPVGNEGEESAVSSVQEAENSKKGKKKKEKKGFFSRKKKDKAEGEGAAASEEGKASESSPQDISGQTSEETNVTARTQPEDEGAEGIEDLFALETDGEPEETKPGSLKDEKKNDKKPGFFSKIMDFLLEEDDDPEAEGDEADQLKTTTDENQEVLKQLKKEDQEGKKKKKKKGKGKDPAGEDAENEEEGDEEAGKDKKKKAKKEKKEKKEKPEEPVDDTPQPKLSKKKVRSTVLFAFTIMAAILICCLFIPELTQLSDARNAFYDGDYETCFRTLYGKRLSESDQRMFEQSQMMLSINRNQEAYENYVAVGDELHALDTLLQAVQKQDKLLSEAEKYGLAAEAEAAYQRVLAVLNEKYQLTEAEAIAINAYEQDAVYTLRVKSIVEGTEFVLPAYLQEGTGASAGSRDSVPEEIVEDVLSAEEELPDMEYEEGILEP